MASPTPSPSVPPGDAFPRAFGKYLLLAPLAQGGMGSLFLACQGEAGMEKLCVVKTVLPQLADKEYVARFRDEAKVVVRLSHGNLVPVFDAGQVGGELYVAMDFVDGKDLRAVWNRCAKKGIAFPVDVAVHITRELCRGLHHAHTADNLHLVHRDVSPPNVLLAFSGEVKLTDFGLASSVLKMEKTAPGVVYGKVSYMAPEQARGDDLDGRVDQYAAGVILWELLTGRQLFPSGDPDALSVVRNPKVDPPSRRATRVPPRLDEIVMTALAPDRNDRYPDCEALRVALAEFLAREAPATDAARVAGFLRELFDDEIESERAERQSLVDRSRAMPRPERRLSRSGSGLLALGPLEGPPSPAGVSGVSGEIEVVGESGIVGRVIGGRYRVVRLVGEGGMGRVYEAEHIEIGKRVALKLLHSHYSRAPDLVQRFRREARAASRIGHPNIVDVTDSGTTSSGEVFFVMEYLDGVDLSRVIEREQVLPVERSVHVAIQLARALEAAHAAGIVHRDLKPENVFLVPRPGENDFVKVLDFGIARHMDLLGMREGRLTDPGMAMGTPEYMAPEQASGQGIDARADIYAVGAILYEMLSGHPPHEGKNVMEVLTRKAAGPPTPLAALRPDVNTELADLVTSALATDPAERQQTMGELAAALERCRPDRRGGRRISEPFGVARGDAPTAGGTFTPSAPTAVAPMATERVSERESLEVPRGQTRLRFALAAAGAIVALGLALVLGRGESSPGVAPKGTAPRAAVAPAGRALAGGDARDPSPPGRRPSGDHRATPPEPRERPLAAVKAPAASEPRPPTPRSQARRGEVVAPESAAADPRHRLDEARRLLRSGQLDEAESSFHHALVGADAGAALAGLAEVASRRGNFADAVRFGQKAVHRGGGLPAMLLLADSFMKVHDYDAAAREYHAILRLHPGHVEAQRGLELAERKAGGG